MAKRELRVVISGDSSQLNRAFSKAGAGATKLEGKVGKVSTGIGRSLATAGKIGTAAIGVGLVGALKSSIDAFQDSEKVAAQTAAVLKSTGGAAKLTAKDVGDLATALSRKSGMDDEAIQSGENLLLTFTKVRNETGKGNDIFSRATSTLVDMSTALGQHTKSSALQLGKALNDPIKGVTALQRVGVSFTKAQKAQITTLVQSGKTLDAQKLILKELNTEFGGSAKAAGDTFAGKIDKAKVSVGNLGEAIGGVLAPALGGAADGLAGFVDKLTTSDRPAKFFDGFKDAADSAKDAISGVFDSVSDQRAGGASLGAAIGTTFANAVGGINWSLIGTKISTGLAGAIKIGGNVAQQVQDGIGAALGQVDGRKLLSGLLRVVAEGINALFSPSFWVENFKNIFAVVTIAIPVGKILKIPGAGVLFNVISKPFFRAVELLGTGMLSLMGRVGGAAVRGLVGEIAKGGGVGAAAVGLIGRAAAGLRGLPGAFKGSARLAVSLLADGLVEGGSRAGAAAGKLVTYIANGIRGRLGDLTNFAINVGKAIVVGIVRGIKASAGAIGGAIKSGIGKIGSFVGIGDGIGRAVGRSSGTMSPGGASGSLMGADSRLAPFASIGRADGLTVTSGKRAAGGRTSSGGISYHGSGEAIDQSGPPAAMMRYFRQMKARYGSRLAELIYTPGGVGIKDGKPFRYTGAVAADHFDHVHTAVDLGAPGPGIGGGGQGGRGDGPGKGDGPGRHGDWTLADYKGLWKRAGGSSSVAALAAAVGMAEGGGHANAINHNSDGSVDRGLWQINSTHGALSTFDPLGNARAAVKISSGGRNWNPWVAYTSGSYRRFLAAARTAAAHAGGSTSSGAAGFGAGLGGLSPHPSFNAPGTMGAMGGRVGAPGFGEGSSAFQSLYAPYQANRDTRQQAFASIAGTTSGLGDDVQAMQMLVANARLTYGEMVKEFGQGSAEAATALAGIVGAEKQLAETAHEAWLKPFRDGISSLNDELVRAQVDTPDNKTDDLAVVTGQLAAATAGYNDAVGRGDADAIVEFGQQVLSFRSDLASLQAAVTDNTSALDGIAAEMKRANDLATSQVGVQNSQLVKSLADLLSGQIVGKGLQPRSQTAGAGRVASY